jgi:hypothetical protein
MTALRLRRHRCLVWKLAFKGADVISVLGLLLANGYARAERVRGAFGALREGEILTRHRQLQATPLGCFQRQP